MLYKINQKSVKSIQYCTHSMVSTVKDKQSYVNGCFLLLINNSNIVLKILFQHEKYFMFYYLCIYYSIYGLTSVVCRALTFSSQIQLGHSQPYLYDLMGKETTKCKF